MIGYLPRCNYQPGNDMSDNAQPERKLTARQNKAIEALIAGQSKEAAAAVAGVTSRQLRRWLHEDVLFGETLERASRAGFFEATVRLSGGLDVAIDQLMQILEDSQASATIRLRAAGLVIDAALKLRETFDILERLDMLETRITANEASNL